MRLPEAIAAQVGGRDPEPVLTGQSGAAVYRVRHDDADLFLKIGHGPAAGLVADEAARLVWLAGRLPTPRVVATTVEPDAFWLLTSALPGVGAGDAIKADRRRATTVAQALATFLRRIHALPVDECPYDSSLAAWMPVARQLVTDDRVDTEDFDDEHADWSAARVLAKVEDLAANEQGRVVVHGDFSLGNVMVDAKGAVVGCLDVGRLGVGDPYRDIFIGWRDLGGFGAEAQTAFLDALGLERLDERRRELHRALDELF